LFGSATATWIKAGHRLWAPDKSNLSVFAVIIDLGLAAAVLIDVLIFAIMFLLITTACNYKDFVRSVSKLYVYVFMTMIESNCFTI